MYRPGNYTTCNFNNLVTTQILHMQVEIHLMDIITARKAENTNTSPMHFITLNNPGIALTLWPAQIKTGTNYQHQVG